MLLDAAKISSSQLLAMLGIFSGLADASASWSPGAQSLVSQLLYLSIQLLDNSTLFAIAARPEKAGPFLQKPLGLLHMLHLSQGLACCCCCLVMTRIKLPLCRLCCWCLRQGHCMAQQPHVLSSHCRTTLMTNVIVSWWSIFCWKGIYDSRRGHFCVNCPHGAADFS